jgi:tetratricopeptide (TPR) repeat protein
MSEACETVNLVNLGATLFHQARFTEAAAAWINALKQNPNNGTAWRYLGIALQLSEAPEEAVTILKQALCCEPECAESWLQLGTALSEIGQSEAPIQCYEQAISLKPDWLEPRCNLSHALLLAGHFEQGWKCLEWNLKREFNLRFGAFEHRPMWRGEPIQSSEQLTLVSEQGYGDTLQFMRYIPHLRMLGFNISLCAQPSLHGIIRSSGIDANPIQINLAKNFTQSAWAPLQAVPGFLGITPAQPGWQGFYIKADAQKLTYWREKLDKELPPRVGLCWQGNPSHELTNLRGRSISLEALTPLSRITGGSLVSLQKGTGSEQLDQCTFKESFVSCQDEISASNCFDDTAAILSCCDLVITTDTAVAHLAAGMGKSTWLLLKHVPEWRWGLHGSDSFWYPSMRLFRQPERGRWDLAIQDVCDALNNWEKAQGS